MERTLKVFCTGMDQDKFETIHKIIERYDGFILIKVDEDKVEEIAQQYPVEDITDQYIIHVGSRIINTSQPRFDVKGKLRAHPDYKGVKRLTTGSHHHLVQFIGPIKEAWLTEVRKKGGEPRAPFEGFSYIVRADEKALATIANLPFVAWIGHLQHRDRIAASVMERIEPKPENITTDLPRTRILSGTYTIEFFDPSDLKNAVLAIEKLGFEVLDKETKSNVIIVRDPKSGKGTAKRIRELSAIHGVRFIRERSFKRTSNNVATGIMESSSSVSDSGLNLTGAGEVIAVCDTGLDTGDPQNIHADFAGRVGL